MKNIGKIKIYFFYTFLCEIRLVNPNSLISEPIYTKVVESPIPHSNLDLINQQFNALLLLPLHSLSHNQAITSNRPHQRFTCLSTPSTAYREPRQQPLKNVSRSKIRCIASFSSSPLARLSNHIKQIATQNLTSLSLLPTPTTKIPTLIISEPR